MHLKFDLPLAISYNKYANYNISCKCVIFNWSYGLLVSFNFYCTVGYYHIMTINNIPSVEYRKLNISLFEILYQYILLIYLMNVGQVKTFNSICDKLIFLVKKKMYV